MIARLDQIQARVQEATEGPWSVIPAPDKNYACINDTSARSILSDWNHTPVVGAADAVFIAAARTDVEKMVKALRAVEAVCMSAANNNPYLTPDEPGTAYVGVEEIRTAIGAALS